MILLNLYQKMSGLRKAIKMILLDTCSFLWLVVQQEKLSPPAIKVIQKNIGNIFISSISAFEIGVKYQKKLISFPYAFDEWFKNALDLHGIIDLPINYRIALGSSSLPLFIRIQLIELL